MKILKNYTKDEVFTELMEKLPVLQHHPDDYFYYEMVYYGNLPLDVNFGKNDTFIRIYYRPDTDNYYYIARIVGKEKRKEYSCNLWNIEQVIEHFKKDIEKSKRLLEQQKMDKIKEDF